MSGKPSNLREITIWRNEKIESVNSFLEPHRARREELAKDMDYVRDVLAEGNKKANADRKSVV